MSSKRAWNRALRSDTLALIIVVIAMVAALSVSFAVMASHSSKTRTVTNPREKTFDAATERSLDAALDKFMKDADVPGAVVGIWVPGKGAYVRARGVSDLKTSQPMSTSDHMRIASVTKSFVATLVLQLADAKMLSLDDALDKYVPSVPNASAITVRELLNHTSGLFDFVADPVFNAAADNNPLEKWKPDQLLSSSVLHEPYFAPGTGYHYSNTNYVLLGMIVEKVTGHKIGEELDRRILKPLGLSNTSLSTRPALPSPSSRGYAERYGTLSDVSEMDPSMGWASSAMVSDLANLKVWSAALADGSLLSEKARQEMTTFVATDMPNVSYGLGIMKWGNFLGHEGNAFGFSTALFHLPSSKATFVVLLNREKSESASASGVFIKFAKILFPDQVPQ
jgi:D-alanyl-D-alanine carboxypeptidase